MNTIDPTKALIAGSSALVVGLVSWIAVNVNQQQISQAEQRVQLENISVTLLEIKRSEQQRARGYSELDKRVTILEQINKAHR